MERLYHKEVFWKNNFDEESLNLVYNVKKLSYHLNEHLNNPDEKHLYLKKDIFKGLEDIKQNKGYLFEVAVENGRVTKAVYRINLNSDYDICIVIREEKVVTAWINRTTDEHRTLDTQKYMRV